jgi:small subunit ribosomal protein S16
VAVKIRLKRMGKIRVPHYRIVVADSRTKRDGRVIEEIGKYHPKEDPSLIEVDSERAQYWLGVGAQPSEPVLVLLKLTGDWQRFQGDADAVSTVRGVQSRRQKSELFNEALKDAHNEPKTEAVTRPKKSAKKAAAPAAADTADAASAADADDSTSDVASPETAPAEVPPAEVPPAEAAETAVREATEVAVDAAEAAARPAEQAASTDVESQAGSAEPDGASAGR